MAGASACTLPSCLPGAFLSACDSVLVINAGDISYTSDVQSKLQGTRSFATVDIFDAGAATPTAEKLAAYHAVVACGLNPPQDATLLGDRLADYHDQGGGVVVTTFANAYRNMAMLQGAYALPANGYALLDSGTSPLDYGGRNTTPNSLGDRLEPQSPLLNGVAYLTAAAAFRSTAKVISGRGIVVARWSGGGNEPLVVRGARGNRTLVELNFFPVSTSVLTRSWTGDGAALLRNALKYTRCLPASCGPGTYSVVGETRRNGLKHGGSGCWDGSSV